MLGKTNSGKSFIEASGLQWQIYNFFIPTQADSQTWPASVNTVQALSMACISEHCPSLSTVQARLNAYR